MSESSTLTTRLPSHPMLIGARFLCFPDGGCVITYYGQFGVVVVVQSVSVVVVYVATVLVNIYIYIYV